MAEHARPTVDIQLLATALEQAPMAVMVVGAATGTSAPTVLYVNPAFTRLTGYEPGEAVGAPPVMLRGPKTDSATVERLRHDLHVGRTAHGSAIAYRRDGSEFVLDWHIAPVAVGDGRAVAYIAILADATERAEADRVRRQQLTAIESSMVGIAILDADERFTYVNDVHARIYGYAESNALIGRRWEQLYTEPERWRFTREIMPALKRSGRWHGEVTGCRADGTLFPTEVSLVAVEDGGLVCIVQDVSERKQAEENVRRLIREETARAEAEASEARFAFLAEVSTILATSLDYERTLRRTALRAVPEFADWCAIHLVEPESRRIHLVALAGTGRDLTDQSASWASADGFGSIHELIRQHDYPVLVQQPSREWIGDIMPRDLLPTAARSLSCIVAPLIARGQPLGTITFLLAESGRRYTPADLALAGDLAQRIALGLDNALLFQQAQQAIRIRDDFLSIAAHELKTPLTTIKGYTQILGRQIDQLRQDPTRLAAITEQLARQVGRLETLVIDLLDVSRIQRGELELRPERHDLSTIAREVATRFANGPERNLTHRIIVDAPEPVDGYWDPERLDQVLTNLLSNAIKYSPENAEIQVSVHTGPDGVAVLSVTDHGYGIPPEDQARLFQPFVRGHAARRGITGTGLGLYITDRIVRRHGGKITVRSQPGEGSTFTVTLPRNLAATS